MRTASQYVFDSHIIWMLETSENWNTSFGPGSTVFVKELPMLAPETWILRGSATTYAWQ
jgi:uncharacterized membrane protein